MSPSRWRQIPCLQVQICKLRSKRGRTDQVCSTSACYAAPSLPPWPFASRTFAPSSIQLRRPASGRSRPSPAYRLPLGRPWPAPRAFLCISLQTLVAADLLYAVPLLLGRLHGDGALAAGVLRPLSMRVHGKRDVRRCLCAVCAHDVMSCEVVVIV